ncbi:transcriptional regulator, TetR family [Thermoanaerobacter thermohydrosulfuricus]|uniref:Transcriptional regulator n=3 Tax=Thermoanaerobacter TaxID=1754 RepID=I9KTK6_9THEO|nr:MULTISPECIES: TetR/AcrR family transcriptional regulator [Thermoanaerobacter]EGD50594.1 transcriptional regulator, TetR family [Thermoanaerobacter ethanolicus JW 200]EIW00289.1 transcriptional regulator [Thermoanaerobacter siderophilus SR4]EMT38084.1 Transcriptional regulator [Thermoanaerobacter thermohydrosulfuricus WC1]UZQ83088.1 TetR/AcrR family transcriptional regulator [Thermoanaerobacter sp. RKWS2]SDF94457.1 transcriptional regulator, TetR family [Thermoanaerobacter thermohydrosulfuri
MNKTKEKIFKAAIKTFSKSGFYKTTMEEIAENAGVAKGTLYYHFKSKDDILEFLIDEGIKILKQEAIEEIGKLNNAVEKLRKIIFVQTNFLYRNHDFIIVLLSQIWGHGEVPRKFREKLYTYLELIENIIREGKEQKLIADCDEKIVAAAFFGMISSILALKVVEDSDEKFNPQDITDSVFNFALKGLQLQG